MFHWGFVCPTTPCHKHLSNGFVLCCHFYETNGHALHSNRKLAIRVLRVLRCLRNFTTTTRTSAMADMRMIELEACHVGLSSSGSHKESGIKSRYESSFINDEAYFNSLYLFSFTFHPCIVASPLSSFSRVCAILFGSVFSFEVW